MIPGQTKETKTADGARRTVTSFDLRLLGARIWVQVLRAEYLRPRSRLRDQRRAGTTIEGKIFYSSRICPLRYLALKFYLFPRSRYNIFGAETKSYVHCYLLRYTNKHTLTSYARTIRNVDIPALRAFKSKRKYHNCLSLQNNGISGIFNAPKSGRKTGPKI